MKAYFKCGILSPFLLFLLCLFCFATFFIRVKYAYANSSFNDLVNEVADETGLSKSVAETVVRASFRKITDRMLRDQGTSVPDFGRFYVIERQKASGKDKDGYSHAPRMIRSPRFTSSKELKKILGD
jgi:DNA-binding protein HU-beta